MTSILPGAIAATGMEKVFTDAGTPQFSQTFPVKSLFLLVISGAILYLLLGATYPPIHDLVHDFRHSLAIVPCH